MRGATVALLVLAMLASQPVAAVGFLTQKELVGRDGDTVIVLPTYTYVTTIQRFGNYALITYRVGDAVRELRVRQGDLDAARPDEALATQTADPEKRAAYYRERLPFDVYIDEFPGRPSTPDEAAEEVPPLYRMRIKTCNLTPEIIPHLRFEVHAYVDAPGEKQGNLLWQFRVLSVKPREFRTVETPVFSIDTLRASDEPETETASTDQKNAAGSTASSDESQAAQESEAPKPPSMRFAVRLFVDEVFVAQTTGIVRQIDEEEHEGSTWRPGPRDSERLRRLRTKLRLSGVTPRERQQPYRPVRALFCSAIQPSMVASSTSSGMAP